MAQALLRGLQDSLNPMPTVRLMRTVPSLRPPILHSMCSCGLLFLGHLLLYYTLIGPFLAATPSLQRLFTSLYYLLWVFPVYCCCFILNSFWYGDVATIVFKHLRGEPKSSSLPFIKRLDFELRRDVLMGAFVLQVTLLAVVPGSWAVVVPALSFLYSYYCFEYRWTLEGKNMPINISQIETNWSYFLGFGLPFTSITYIVPGLMGSGLWALLFPFFIITGMTATPPETAGSRLPVFKTAEWAVKRVERWLEPKLDK